MTSLILDLFRFDISFWRIEYQNYIFFFEGEVMKKNEESATPIEVLGYYTITTIGVATTNYYTSLCCTPIFFKPIVYSKILPS